MNNCADVDSTLVIYCDSVDSIILGASKMRIYDMADFTITHNSHEKKDSLL